MIIIYLCIAFNYLRKMMRKLGRETQLHIMLYISIAVVGMILYELYVEFGVGWRYGIPKDDDTGWISRAAAAIKEGTPLSHLYLLAGNDARMLSLSTIGQYFYVIFLSTALYFPTFFSIRVNLYLVYLFQITLASYAIVNCCFALESYCTDIRSTKRPHKSLFFFLMLFYPVVLFNTYKTLRETFFIFFSLKTFSTFVQAKEHRRYFRKLIFYSFCLLVIRPNAIILVFTMIVWILFGEQIAFTSGIVVSGLILFGNLLVSKITQMLGWQFGFDSISVNELIHLLLFPSPISQTQNMLRISQNPSWVTLLYFFQSIWNIPILLLCGLGMIYSIKRKKHLVWMPIWLNCVMVYSLAYSIQNLTPRYKLIYLIPQTVFLYVGLSRIER